MSWLDSFFNEGPTGPEGPAGPPASVTGTGFFYSVSGSLHASGVTLTSDISQGAESGGNVPLTVVAIQGNEVNSATPSAGQLLVFSASTGWTPVSFSGDSVISSLGVVTVHGIQGNTVTSGGLTKGNFFVASSTSNWAQTTLSGDVTASATTPGQITVVAINEASVPVAGSLITGNSLHVTGASALGYGPLNLAGGANYITGRLPLLNLAYGTGAQVLVTNAGATSPVWVTFAGDVTNTGTGATYVGAISGVAGAGGTIPITANVFNFEQASTIETTTGALSVDATIGSALNLGINTAASVAIGPSLAVTTFTENESVGTITTAASEIVLAYPGTSTITCAPVSAGEGAPLTILAGNCTGAGNVPGSLALSSGVNETTAVPAQLAILEAGGGAPLFGFCQNGFAVYPVTINISTGSTGGTSSIGGDSVYGAIRLTGTLTGGNTLVFPNTVGMWYVDISGLGSFFGVNTLTFKSGTATTVPVTSTGTNSNLLIVATFGSNSIVLNQ
jgi:hypothetical protein